MLLIFLGVAILREFLGSLHEFPTLGAFISHFFLLQSMTGAVGSFNSASWSISTEFWVYLIFGLFMLMPYRLLMIGMVIIFSYSLLAIGEVSHPLDGPHWTLLFRCLYSFFIGVIAFLVSKSLKKYKLVWLPPLLLIASVIAVSELGYTSFDVLIPWFFALTIIAISKLENRSIFYKLMVLPPLIWLGTVSYSIYMVHSLVWAIIGGLLKIMTSTHVENGVRIFNFTDLEALIITIISVAILLWCSHISYRYIELRFRGGSYRVQ
jgi:peptidoglycan/LPS O-acetylase OafA/YrhL